MKVSFTVHDFEQQLIKFSPIVPGRQSRTVRVAQFSLSNSQAQAREGGTDIIQSFLASLDDLSLVAVQTAAVKVGS